MPTEPDSDSRHQERKAFGAHVAQPGLDAVLIKLHLQANALTDDLKSLIAGSPMLSLVANTLHGTDGFRRRARGADRASLVIRPGTSASRQQILQPRPGNAPRSPALDTANT